MESSPTIQVPGAAEDDDAAGRPGGGASEMSGRGSRRSDASPRPGTPAVNTFNLLIEIVRHIFRRRKVIDQKKKLDDHTKRKYKKHTIGIN